MEELYFNALIGNLTEPPPDPSHDKIRKQCHELRVETDKNMRLFSDK